MFLSIARWAGAVACLAFLITGCGGERHAMPAYPVSGKVLVGGQPAVGAKVSFIGLGDEFRAKGAPIPTATVNDTGGFLLTSYETDDGAPEGKYRVVIVWNEAMPQDADPEGYEPRDRLQGKYNHENSTLEAEVPGKPVELPPFEL